MIIHQLAFKISKAQSTHIWVEFWIKFWVVLYGSNPFAHPLYQQYTQGYIKYAQSPTSLYGIFFNTLPTFVSLKEANQSFHSRFQQK